MSRKPRVVVTRARAQSSALADRLSALGAEPVILPLLSIQAPSVYEPLDDALSAIASFDWLVFSSSNAVEAAIRRSLQLGLKKPLSGPRTAAIGPATAASLTGAGLAVDLVARLPVAESLAEDLSAFVKTEPSPTRFLLIQAEHASDVVPRTLRTAGAEVTVVPAYRNVVPPEALTQAVSLFGGRAPLPDVITFTSSSSARHLFAVLEQAKLTLAREIIRASIGPVTSATLRELNFAPDVEAETATVDALARSVMQELQQRTLRSAEERQTHD